MKQFAIAGELDDARKAQRDANGRLVFGAWTLRCNKCPTNFLTSLFDNSPAVVFVSHEIVGFEPSRLAIFATIFSLSNSWQMLGP